MKHDLISDNTPIDTLIFHINFIESRTSILGEVNYCLLHNLNHLCANTPLSWMVEGGLLYNLLCCIHTMAACHVYDCLIY